VVLAEMRTGSNFLEANLNALDGVSCLGEAFNPFFIGGEGKQEMLGVDMAAREANPARFLRVMREQTPGLSGFRYFSDHDPRVFDLVMNDPACAKIILTRNQLESYISWKIAVESDQWWLANTKHLKTVRPRFDLAEFEERLTKLQAFQKTIQHRLQVTGQTAYYIDYDDILDLEVLNGLAAFLGVDARLASLDFRFKKQNPEAIRDKVQNPAEMEAGLATVDWFNIQQTPNFEPRRTASVPQYIASAGAPLLFQPVKSAPEAQLRKWLSSFGETVTGFDRKTLKAWKDSHHGFRSFTVLRHPLARAHAAFSDYIAREYIAELRPYLKRVHRFQLPGKGKGFESPEAFREGFVVFLDFLKHNLNGRTEIRVMPQFATQGTILQGFAHLQSPDHAFREDRLAEGLAFLTAEIGLPCPPLPANPEKHPVALADIWGEDLEKAAEEAYWRDYAAFGFGRWKA
jgi:LPS sulfotransferase NodH